MLAGYHKAVIAAFGNVEDALIDVRETAEQQQRQEEAVRQGEARVRADTGAVSRGDDQHPGRPEYRDRVVYGQDTLVQVKYSHLKALIALFSALGGGWQRV